MSDDKREITMAEIMPPHAANFSGNVHGGHIMLLLDQVAYACAVKYAGQFAVTLSVDQILFKEPIYVGDLVNFYASVNFVGRTSMEVGIKVIAEDLLKGTKRHTNTCYFSMVSVDDKGKPIQIEPLEMRNKTDEYRFKEAQLRRKLRFESQAHHQKAKRDTRHIEE